MLTGVIYGAIVLVWAAYLVPLALRRHDEAHRRRSVERFSSAMRVLTHRSATPDQRSASESGRAQAEDPQPQKVFVPAQPNRPAARAAAARRRRVLTLLIGLLVVVGLASLVGVIPRLSVVVPLLMVVGFLVIARRSVRRATRGHWVEVDDVEDEGIAVSGADDAPLSNSTTAGGLVVGMGDDEPTITLTAAQCEAAAARVTRERVAMSMAAPGGSLWDPLPVTLPTYVDAPVARRTLRTISLNEPGVWSSGRGEQPADDHDDPVDEVPRAVNG